MLHLVVLPSLQVLALNDCGRLTAAGVLPLLRNAPRLEVLYLGLLGVVSRLREWISYPSNPSFQ